jgi:hypothetical protein
VFTNGNELPQKLITAIQVTTVKALSNIFISRITVVNDYLSILLKENDTGLTIGNFYGQVQQNQQTLMMDPLTPLASGSITIGDAAALSSLNGTYYLDYQNGRLEPSTVFCFTPPGVTSLMYAGTKATGYVNISSASVTVVSDPPEIKLSAKNPDTILSNADLGAANGNCPTPIIKKINTVTPNEFGNIDIYGVIPIQINVASGTRLELTTVPELSFKDLCPERNKILPPADDTTTVYHGDIFTKLDPEWKSWNNP